MYDRLDNRKNILWKFIYIKYRNSPKLCIVLDNVKIVNVGEEI